MRTRRRCLLFFAFIPEGCELLTMAGLLTCSLFAGLPVIPLNDSGAGWAKGDSFSNQLSLQLRVQFRISTGFPFHRIAPNRTQRTIAGAKIEYFFCFPKKAEWQRWLLEADKKKNKKAPNLSCGSHQVELNGIAKPE